MGPPLVKRLLARIDDVLRRREVRLPDFQMNYVFPLRFQSTRAHEHIERGFGTDPRHSFSQSHNLLSSSFMWFCLRGGFLKKRNSVASSGFDHAIVDSDALSLDAGRDAAAIVQFHDDDLVRHIRRKPFGREMNYSLGVNEAGAHSVSTEDRNHAGCAASAEVLGETHGVPFQLSVARLAADLLYQIANLRDACGTDRVAFRFQTAA